MIDLVRFLAAVLFTVPASVAAEALTVSDILASREPHIYIDGLKHDERKEVISKLADSLERQEDKGEIAKLLCAIAPWTTGDAVRDIRLQEYAWAQMALLDVNSEEFRWLDCTASNAVGGYRDRALAPLYDLRQSYCAGVPISTDMPGYLTQVEEGIRDFDARMTDGLASAAGANDTHGLSFYPTRNLFRLAIVRAARAVEIGRSDWPAAQREFADIAADLREAEKTTDFARTRSAWNYPNDLAFYSALYAWVAGSDENLAFDPLLVWPPLLEDPSLAAAVPQPVRKQIEIEEPGYVEMIFVERLFPGAAEPGAAECDGWRRRSYNVRRISKVVKECAEKLGRPADLNDLAALDACILAYDADDWRVQFLTVAEKSAATALKDVEACVRNVLTRPEIAGLSEAERDGLEDALTKLRQEDAGTDAIRVVTEHVITTPQRVVLEQIFDLQECTGVPRPLMARPRMF